MALKKKTPYAELKRKAEEMASAVIAEAENLEDAIEEALTNAWQEGYDEGEEEGRKVGYDEGHDDGMTEAEENFRKKEKVKFT